MLRSIILAGLVLMGAPAAADVTNDQLPPVVTTCGHLIGSITKQMGMETIISREDAPVPLPHANAMVRAGRSLCIKVRFVGHGRCLADVCKIRVMAGNQQMPGGYDDDADPPFDEGSKHHEFILRVNPGLYKVEVRMSAYNQYPNDPDVQAYLWLGGWILDVSTYH